MKTLIKHNLTGSIFRCRIVLPTVLVGGIKSTEHRPHFIHVVKDSLCHFFSNLIKVVHITFE